MRARAITCGHKIPGESWRGPDGDRVFCVTDQAVRLVRVMEVDPVRPLLAALQRREEASHERLE